MGILDIVGGEPTKKTTKTSVKDKFFGGKKVKKTTVRQRGDKTQVQEDVTETWPDGSHKKSETTVSGDDI